MIIKETLETAVKNEYDVAVCGGGFAGISAALAAARQGSKVVLFEKDIPLKTLLCTGGGRCNLAYAEFDLKSLASIAYLISSANTSDKSKIIYDLANNPEVIDLQEEGLAIMEEVYKAATKEEIDYILNEKYNINNLGDLVRLTKIFESDSNTIIEELKKLENEDISKDTIVRRKLRK